MTEAVRRTDLVISLANVVISALSGPLGVVGVAAAKELVKTCQAVWDRNSPERQLRDSVQRSIEAWCKGERIESETLDRGLGWAVEYVQAAGSRYEVIAAADFDPRQATAAVLDHVKRSDKYWGTEVEYAVAERAVDATYRALCAGLKSEGGLVLAAVQATRHAVLASIEGLRAELVGVADRDELMRYLRAKINEWDFSPWTQGKSPSLLERTLRIDTADVSRKRLLASEALAEVWLLVVLGGPGSGKTWLAQRYAREAAEAALDQFRDPRVDPAAVELPLLTSWAGWAAHPGGGIDAFVAAALPAVREDRIRRSVLRPGARVLAVADSLDEAGAGESAARTLLRSLTGTPGWRVVVTSRPEAWDSTASALSTREGVRIGTLVGLSYPDDVHRYIRQWFTNDSVVAKHLIGQIERRRELRDTATVPLLLTFYCMLTEQAPGQSLPWRPRDLYGAIIDRLLTRRWSGQEPEHDLKGCREVLQSWAWGAVEEAVTPVGLGAWTDQFTTGAAAKALEKALDCVVPKQKYPTHSRYDHTQVERRFLHRTLLEHSVAEHIATFSAARAADVLLPHVWFDPDWAVTLPMAIAAHPDRDALVDLLWATYSETPTPAGQVANTGLEGVLLDVAAQTLPSDWNIDHRDLIDGLRVTAAPLNPGNVTKSAHWFSSNAQAAQAILASLPTATQRRVGDLVVALKALVVTDTDRASARHAILDALPTATQWTLGILVGALTALNPTDAERASARDTILDALTTADPQRVVDLGGALTALGPTDAERASARHTILNALPTATQWTLGDLIDALTALDPTDTDRANARHTILNALPAADPDAAGVLVGALTALVVTDTERASARHTIRNALPTADPATAGVLVGTLTALVVTDTDRASARDTIRNALPTATQWTLGDLVGALTALDPTDTDRASARHIILNALPTADLVRASVLALILTAFDPTDTDRASARHTILNALPTADAVRASLLVVALTALDPTDTERASARHTILNALPTAKQWTVGILVGALTALDPTDTDGSSARHAILDALPTANPRRLVDLVGALTALDPTETGRASARHAILDALPTADPETAVDLVGAVTALDPTDSERASARHTILNALPTADPRRLLDLIRALTALDPTDTDRASARQAILDTLPTARPRSVVDLVRALRNLAPVLEWLGLLSVPPSRR